MLATKDRFVTGCQQLLALGAVLAVLTPAARTITLDVVHEAPADAGGAIEVTRLSGYALAQATPSVVPAGTVDPVVTEYALTAPAHARVAPGALHARTTSTARRTAVVADPQPVTGYGAIGVTWQHGAEVADDAIAFEARTRTGGAWSAWADMEYHDEHAPDPDSAEGRRARPGTTELIVGDVDAVQVRVRSEVGVPPDMRLAVVDPGEADAVAQERPELETDALDGGPAQAPAPPEAAPVTSEAGEGAADALALRAAAYTPKPVVYSRAQWGANEKLRRAAPTYYEVHAGFVHHTVNANDYTRAEVPAILRGIYAYHTQSRGWSDVGYNYLVDKFGRIWEGRAGGIDRPVVGAHTLGYNESSFAMSAIGNFDVKRPSRAMVAAYGALFAWKLSLHGVDARSASQSVGRRSFPAINGHRDAGSTACPGKYLYARLPAIRLLATQAQQGWSGRELESDVTGTPHPDLLVRSTTDGQAYVLPTGGLTRLRAPRTVATGWSGATVLASPDLTGDGRADLLVRRADGTAEVRPADGTGGFGEPVRTTDAFADLDLVTPVGDLDRDGHHDVAAREPGSNRLDLFLGRGDGRFRQQAGTTGWGAYDLLVGPGDVDGDDHADLLARDAAGRLWRHSGAAALDPQSRAAVPGGWGAYSSIVAAGDQNHDGHADLFVQRRDNRRAFLLQGRGDGSFSGRIGPLGRTTALTGLTAGGDVVGDAASDVVARRGDAVVVLENAGTFETTTPVPTGVDVRSADALLNAGDWDRDGHSDMITREASTGTLLLRRGDGAGGFSGPTTLATGFRGVQLLAAVGDMTGDGWPDLMGQPAGGAMRLYPGAGLDGLRPGYVARSRIAAARQVPVGRWNGDGAPDSLFRDGDRLLLYPGNGPGGLTTPSRLDVDLKRYDWVVGISDVGLAGHADLVLRSKADGRLWLLPGKADGFGARRLVGEGMGAYDLVG
ncbi:FG-GAP-like repeat-containing protein [Nocardioides sp. SYSU DS0663]|uniref:FG-GAP-like repeat-containing protein n=1 Tax=Nocardioides sp. SYSU DS0663 TaxID=3416445 RepID=UPI003F4B1D50